MKLYFTYRSLPELKDKPLEQRLENVNRATKKLTPPEKMLLNIVKLLVIVPVFALILRAGQDWTSMLWASLFIILYPVVLKPIQLGMIRKYL